MKPFIPREWIRMRKQPDFEADGCISAQLENPPVWFDFWNMDGGRMRVKAPYSPGEVYWVRETWRHIANSSHPGMPVEAVIQYSDMTIKYRGSWPDFANAPKEAWWNTGKQPWRSPVTMPQWASRRHVRILSCVPEQRGEWGWRVEWEESK